MAVGGEIVFRLAFAKLVVCTEYQWKQISEGIRLGVVGPYTWKNYVYETDVTRQHWTNKNNPKLEAAMLVEDTISDRHALDLTRTFAATKKVLRLTAGLPISELDDDE